MKSVSLLLLASAFSFGIVLSSLWVWKIRILYFAMGIISLAIILILKNKPERAAAGLVILFLLLGMLRAVQESNIPTTDIRNYIGHKVTVTGRIDDNPQISEMENERRIRYIVDVNSLLVNDQHLPATGKIITTVKNAKAAGSFGDEIRLSGELIALNSYHNPGSIDAVAAWNRQGIGARMTVMGEEARIVADPSSKWQRTIYDWRGNLTELAGQVMAPSDAAVLNGILFGGGYNSIKPETLKEFAATGIIHILSVSGSHIALVTAVMLWIGDQFRLRVIGKVVLATSAMLMYALLAGLNPPVIRSTIMGLIALFALLSEREQNGKNALALAAVGILAWKPSLLYDISFQLSFAGTAGLLFFYSKTTASMYFIPRPLASGLAVTIAAQAGMLPFLAWYFHSLPLGSLIANLLVVPIIEIVIIIGLIAVVLSIFTVGVAKLFFVACSLAIGLAVMLNKSIASLGSLQLYIPPFSLIAGVIYYALLAWIYGYLFPKINPYQTIRRWPVKTAAAILVAGVIAIFYIAFPRPLEVHFIDVGQGDATLVITPHRRAVMVDTGGTTGDASRFDIGERVVVPYLKHQGITAVDFLILTHGHQDHAGGAAAVATALPVNTILIAPEELTSSVRTLITAKKQGVIIPAVTGQRIEVDGVGIDVLHAGDQTSERNRSGNETSSLIRITYGKHSFLLTGDLEAEQEKRIVQKGLEACTVLKVAHHGARTSSSEPFLDQVRPRYAVISVGANNRFGHPHPEIIDRLQRRGIQLFRTDRDGAMLFQTDGSMLSVHPYLPFKN